MKNKAMGRKSNKTCMVSQPPPKRLEGEYNITIEIGNSFPGLFCLCEKDYRSRILGFLVRDKNARISFMTQLLAMHPITPQLRLAKQVAAVIQADGVIVYPTDSGYALGCRLNNKAGLDSIRQIRRLDNSHLFTLVCRD